ncbi:MAG: helix-turn-helix transcriptional regulator [Floccifex sp.]
MPLKNRLKECRASKGYNQQELARLAGVSRQTISSIERGDYHPSVFLALKICALFDKQVEDVFYLEEEYENK